MHSLLDDYMYSKMVTLMCSEKNFTGISYFFQCHTRGTEVWYTGYLFDGEDQGLARDDEL